MDTVQQLGGAAILVICGVLCCGVIVVGGILAALWRSGILRELLGGVSGALGGEDNLLGDDSYIPRGSRYRRSRRRTSRAAPDLDTSDSAARRTRRRRSDLDTDDEIDSFLDEVEIDGEDY